MASSLEFWMIKHAFCAYVIAVLVSIFYMGINGIKISVVEFGSHAVFITLMGMVLKMYSELLSENLLSQKVEAFGSLSTTALLTMSVATFLFGVSVGKHYTATEKKEGQSNTKDDAEPKMITLKAVTNPSDKPSPSFDMSDIYHEDSQVVSAMNPLPSLTLPTNSQNDRDPHDATIDEAKDMLLSLVDNGFGYRDKEWNVVRTNDSRTITISTSKAKEDGILIRGVASANIDPKAVLKWLIDHDLVTGFEGITHNSEIINRHPTSKGDISVRKIYCKFGSLLHSKRDFNVVTSFVSKDDGSHIISNRSVSDDFAMKIRRRRDGSVRGKVFVSGFVLRKTENETCEISIGVHMDLMRSATGRDYNVTKLNKLIESIFATFTQIQQGCPPKQHDHKLDGRMVQTTHVELTREQTNDLVSVAKKAMNKMKELHSSVIDQADIPFLDEDNVKNRNKWKTFYSQDGIKLRELNNSSAPLGVLNASCSVKATPEVVRKMLVEHPDAIDGLVEGRATLTKLNANAYVQWLAYSSIWPVGAKDFLLVTMEEDSYEKGFMIVSTSIDHICQVEEEDDDGNDLDDAEKFRYTRSCLRLAGYIGVPNKTGGTDVSIFVDIDVNSFVPAWLLHVLAQYGLSEMMTRIRDPSFTSSRDMNGGRSDMARILSQIQTRDVRMRRYLKENNLAGMEEFSARSDNESSEIKKSKKSKKEELGQVEEDVEDRQSRKEGDGKKEAEKLPLHDTPFAKRGAVLAEEALKKMNVFLGLEKPGRGQVDPKLDWVEKTSDKKKNVVVSSSSVNESTWGAVRGVAVIKVDKNKLLKFLTNDSNIGLYDDMFDKAEFITTVDDRTTVRRMMFKAIWPTAPRDFLACTTWVELDNGCIMVATRSAPDDLFPQAKGYVRGFIQLSGYYIQPHEALPSDSGVPPGCCKVTLTAHTELGGTLPVSVINMLSTAAPLKLLCAVGELVNK